MISTSQGEGEIMLLKQERLRRGLTQTQLGALTGISPQDISLIENGWRKPFRGWKKRLADALEMSVESLFPEVTDDG